MRTIAFLMRKEFLQIIRNKAILPVIFLMPIIQLLILSFAADFEIRNLKLYWIDQDKSTSSDLLRQKLVGSGYFVLSGMGNNAMDGDAQLEDGTTDLVIVIPAHFERDLIRENSNSAQLIVNAIDGTKAGLGNYYVSQVVGEWNQEIREKFESRLGTSPSRPQIVQPTYSFWFNPALNYKTFMVPGILVLLITMIGAFIAAMNVVREKELGTIEQINVTPIKKYQFILGKLTPLWIIGLIEFTLGLIVAKLVFSIPILGSIFLLYLFAGVYMVMVLGMGMLISTMTDTQQQAMFIAWFFLVIFILMSGLFTPIENMPDWAQKITLVNPIRYFIEVVRMVMLKGATFSDISHQMIVISAYAVAINGLAVWRYKKVN